ncbi:phage holin family protein [Naasia aerilata]|uniref:Superfamily III holin-X n=1 Tax=Naasia aerilata TaxID=1162966 RepID=A0ABN6XKN5_9MICO|nr:phage holin family protein [Naasia aerilata]BDZ45426.1 hypothetical protein GCM10025866_13350 [Naasia aerilata]
MTSGSVPVSPRGDRQRVDGKKKSLIQLIGDVPGLLSQLVQDEIAQIKQELGEKAKKLGLGAGLFAGAAFFGFFAFAVFLTVAILVLAIWLPAWAAALIVLVVLLILAAVLALLGLREVKKGVPPTPEESLKSVKDDVRAIKGMGKYDR